MAVENAGLISEGILKFDGNDLLMDRKTIQNGTKGQVPTQNVLKDGQLFSSGDPQAILDTLRVSGERYSIPDLETLAYLMEVHSPSFNQIRNEEEISHPDSNQELSST